MPNKGNNTISYPIPLVYAGKVVFEIIPFWFSRSYHFGFHVRDLTDKSLNSKIEMKRKSRLPRQKTVEQLQELLKRAHNKEE